MSSTPGSSLPTTGIWDKAEHAGAYFVLAVLTVRALLVPPALRDAALVAVAIIGFAALDEWHQALIPGRFPDQLDWVADTVGALVGVAVTSIARLHLAGRMSRTPG